jgi:hypothetical protein
MSDDTQVEVVEQESIVIQRSYKLYVVDNTSRMHTIRIGNGIELRVWDLLDINDLGLEPAAQQAPYIITHENALSFYEVFTGLILGNKVFSFKNENCALIFKTKDLIGIQIVPEEY